MEPNINLKSIKLENGIKSSEENIETFYSEESLAHSCKEEDSIDLPGPGLSLDSKERLSSSPHRYSECPEALELPGQSDSHEQRVNGKKNFECHLCSKRCDSNRDLGRHVATHFKSRRFPCSICSGKFKTKEILRIHLKKIHHEPTPFKCVQCRRKFKTEFCLNEHIKLVHLGLKPMICGICGKRFKSEKGFRQHTKRYPDSTEFECEICQNRFHTEKGLIMHRRKHTDRFVCNTCGSRFKIESNFTLHVQSHLEEEEVEEVKNDFKFSGRVYQKRQKLNSNLATRPVESSSDLAVKSEEIAHHPSIKEKGIYVDAKGQNIQLESIKPEDPFRSLTESIETLRREESLTHTSKEEGLIDLPGPDLSLDYKECHKDFPYQCSHCAEAFRLPGLRNRHVQRVHEEAKYECEFCFKKFGFKPDFTRHVSIHKTRSFLCSICSKTFKSISNLNSHQKNIHFGAKPFPCDKCRRRFDTKSGLNKHFKLAHTNLKPFACKLCGWRFKTNRGLAQHTELHSDSTDHECKICQKRFHIEKGLKIHKLKYHCTGNRFFCKSCGKGFKSENYLNRHKFLHSVKATYNCKYCGKAYRYWRGLNNHLASHSMNNSSVSAVESKETATGSAVKEEVQFEYVECD